MAITRKQFLFGLAGGTVTLLVQGCGGGGSGTGTAGVGAGGGYNGMPNPVSACGAGAITNNHGHAVTIPSADLDATTNRTYSIMGTATHDHSITLTPAQLATLKGGGTVVVSSTVTTAAGFGSHNHDVTVTCM
ncbi:MAG: hypothetical protein ACJ8G7_19105 [Rhizobacter sp.]